MGTGGVAGQCGAVFLSHCSLCTNMTEVKGKGEGAWVRTTLSSAGTQRVDTVLTCLHAASAPTGGGAFWCPHVEAANTLFEKP